MTIETIIIIQIKLFLIDTLSLLDCLCNIIFLAPNNNYIFGVQTSLNLSEFIFIFSGLFLVVLIPQ